MSQSPDNNMRFFSEVYYSCVAVGCEMKFSKIVYSKRVRHYTNLDCNGNCCKKSCDCDGGGISSGGGGGRELHDFLLSALPFLLPFIFKQYNIRNNSMRIKFTREQAQCQKNLKPVQ